MKRLEVNQAQIQEWLRAKLAQAAKIVPTDVDHHADFWTYGLSSVVAVEVAGELEEWLDLTLEPTLLWDYPTIETLSAYLYREGLKKP
jgi:acyl carrier protein